MPRGPRLDAPDTLHHVMARGIERRRIFETPSDCRDFVARLEVVVGATGLRVLAWAVLPNHVHLLVRTGKAPLANAMRCLLTGYAVGFNRRHKRHGHLFQNRFKSVLVEAERYLLELTRYIHLNPLRGKVVRDLAALDRYLWTGHSALLGRVPRPWQAVDDVLGQFGRQMGRARQRYRQFVAEGIPQGRRPDLQGGGLRRSAGGWEGLAALRRGRERWASDERVLGSGPFVAQLLQGLAPPPSPRPRAQAVAAFPAVIASCAAGWGVTLAEVCGGSRRRVVARARAAASHVGVTELGLPIAHVARALGVSPPVVRTGLARGPALLRERGLTAAFLVTGRIRKAL